VDGTASFDVPFSQTLLLWLTDGGFNLWVPCNITVTMVRDNGQNIVITGRLQP